MNFKKINEVVNKGILSNDFLTICDEYFITPNELILILAITNCNSDDADKKQWANDYFSLGEWSRGNLRDMLEWLQSKGIISTDYKIPDKGGKFEPEKVKFA